MKHPVYIFNAPRNVLPASKTRQNFPVIELRRWSCIFDNRISRYTETCKSIDRTKEIRIISRGRAAFAAGKCRSVKMYVRGKLRDENKQSLRIHPLPEMFVEILIFCRHIHLSSLSLFVAGKG